MSNIKFSQLPDLANITPSTIVPVVEGGTNYTVTGANLQAFVNSTPGNISATGNITGNYIFGNGSQLTGLPATYGNANVAAYLPTYTGVVGAGSVSATGNIAGNYIFGNGSQLTGITVNYSNANVAAYLPTYSGNLTANTISASGNITAAFLAGDGSQITNLPPGNYSNANVAAYLPTYTGVVAAGSVSATGNITGNFIVGNISTATGGYGNANVQSVLQTYTGTLTAGSANVTGNVTGNFFIGNGSALTGITASLGGTMTSNISGGGFSIINLNTLTGATVSVTGNVTAAQYLGNGNTLSGIPTSIIAGTGISVNASTGAVTITNNNPTPYTNANVAAYLPTYTGALTGNSLSVSGNITGGNISGNFVGSGGNLSNVVTSIVAGTGISVNASTGAVTITATGGGGGSSGKITSSMATGTYGFGTTTISAQATIPGGTFSAGDVVDIYAQWINNNNGDDQRFGNIYIGPNSGTLIGALQVYSGISSSAANSFAKIQTRLEIINSTDTRYYFTGSGIMNSLPYATGLGISPTGLASANINWGVTQYIIFTGRNSLGGASAGLASAGYQIYKG